MSLVACVMLWCAAAAVLVVADRRASAYAPYLYVNAATGSDSNPGTSPAQPLQSIRAARNLVRAMQPVPYPGVTVFLYGDFAVANATSSGDDGSLVCSTSCTGDRGREAVDENVEKSVVVPMTTANSP
jgi:hypothetical protein